MCGIIGQLGAQPPAKQVLQSIHHRGPDANGLQHIQLGTQDLWLGHTRLSIVELSEAGAQPMQSQDGRWWLSFNGEIYNHKEHRHRSDVRYRGSSDTETLVELLAAIGIQATLPLVNGMYAFAAVDTLEHKLYLVRDPFGIKPLYYQEQGSRLSFCSELKGLRALGAPLTLSSTGREQFLTLRYVPSPDTLIDGIQRLPPGHVYHRDLRSGQAGVSPFIKATQTRFEGSFADACDAYQHRLAAAVERQLMSDVPVGILLSGGIDSALVAAMADQAGSQLTGFTVGFGEDHSECEISDAAHTAKVLGLEHRSIIVDPEQLWEAIPDIVASVEEPLGTTSILPMWYLVQKAREEVTVVLTGQGSDEPWGGYRRYQLELLRAKAPDALWRLSSPFLKPLPGLLEKQLPEHLLRGLRSVSPERIGQRFLNAYELFTPAQRQLLIGSQGNGNALETLAYWLQWQEGTHPIAEKMMRIDSRLNLADDLLLYGDKISMAVALEARVPMLDLELMQFIESLPLSYKVNRKQTKRVHKAMAESFLPGEIVHRKKKGFQVPFGDWSRGIWRERIEALLLQADAPHLELINRSGLHHLWQQHLQQKPDRSRQIFSLVMLAHWMRWLREA